MRMGQLMRYKTPVGGRSEADDDGCSSMREFFLFNRPKRLGVSKKGGLINDKTIYVYIYIYGILGIHVS